MKENKKILKGGQSTASVIQFGNTVHRTKSANHNFVHTLLQFLQKKNFSYSPKFLGINEQGQEILSFIQGEVPRRKILTDNQLILSIKILRAFHDCASLSDLCNGHETICHNDFASWNVIFQNEEPVGMIDFDEAAPGRRIDDVAYFIWTFLDLGNEEFTTEDQIRKTNMLCETYQLKNKQDLTIAFLKQQNRILEKRKNIVTNSSNSNLVEFSKGAIQRIESSIKWVKENQKQLNA